MTLTDFSVYMSSQMAPTLIILVYYTTYVMVQERFEEIPRYLIVFTQSTPMPIIGLLGVMKNCVIFFLAV